MGGVVRPGCEISRERTARHIARHRHLAPYAALVLRGGYVEAGDRGRFRASAGDVLLHDQFEAHQDQFEAAGADILNLTFVCAPEFGFGRVADPDRIARVAEMDPNQAAELLLEELVPAASMGLDDWPDMLARDIRLGKVERLSRWAEANGLAPSSVSRGFRLAYGISPQRYRTECRAGAAARALHRSRVSIASIALASGFADQPHMTRCVGRLFGRSPARLRVHVNCVQDGPAQPR